MDTSLPQRATAPALPEVDPELAEMEAAMAVSRGDERVSVDNSTMQRILAGLRGNRVKKAASGATPPGEKGVRDQRWKRGQDRKVRRALQQADGQLGGNKVGHARLGRSKPVKSAAQQVSEYKAAVRGELSRIKLTMLLAECPEIKFVIGTPGLRNVWQLSQATTATVHAIPGFGPKRRKAVREYLVDKRIPCSWVS